MKRLKVWCSCKKKQNDEEYKNNACDCGFKQNHRHCKICGGITRIGDK